MPEVAPVMKIDMRDGVGVGVGVRRAKSVIRGGSSQRARNAVKSHSQTKGLLQTSGRAAVCADAQPDVLI